MLQQFGLTSFIPTGTDIRSVPREQERRSLVALIGPLQITTMDPSDRHLLHLGTTSVVSVLMNAEAIIHGAPVRATMRYTRVWHKRPEGGGWSLVT
jgi:hypothetical protein